MSMAKLRNPFFGLKAGTQDVSSAVSTKTTRRIGGGSYISVRLPGAGEVRLDLKKHIDKSLKTTSDAISKRYQLTTGGGKRKR